MRISLVHALVLVAAAAMSLAALTSGHPLWGDILFCLTVAALLLGALAALAWDGDERRWFALGFVLVGALSFWNAGRSGEGIRRLPLRDIVVDFFHQRYLARAALPVGAGDLAYRTESGRRIIVRDSQGHLRTLDVSAAANLGYAVENLQAYRDPPPFQEIADHVATLLLAYLGGLAGLLVRRARRTPETAASDRTPDPRA